MNLIGADTNLEKPAHRAYAKEEDKSMKIDGLRIMLMRKKRGITQKELAEKLTINQSYISRIENGEAVNVTLDIIDEIAKALDIAPTYILGLSDSPEPSDQVFNIEDPTLKELMSIYGGMGAVSQAKLLEIARVLQE